MQHQLYVVYLVFICIGMVLIFLLHLVLDLARKKEYEELTPEEQEEFLDGLREHIRIENEFQEAVYKQIYGLTIEDGNGNGKDTNGGMDSFYFIYYTNKDIIIYIITLYRYDKN